MKEDEAGGGSKQGKVEGGRKRAKEQAGEGVWARRSTLWSQAQEEE